MRADLAELRVEGLSIPAVVPRRHLATLEQLGKWYVINGLIVTLAADTRTGAAGLHVLGEVLSHLDGGPRPALRPLPKGVSGFAH